MNGFESEISLLARRLPELEWQLSRFGPVYCSVVPAGLFRRANGQVFWTSTQVIEDIRQDLVGLSVMADVKMQGWMVQHLSRKIEVVLRICRTTSSSSKEATTKVHAIMTRQQWLKALSEKKEKLSEMEHALLARLTYASPALKIQLHEQLDQIRAQLTQEP